MKARNAFAFFILAIFSTAPFSIADGVPLSDYGFLGSFNEIVVDLEMGADGELYLTRRFGVIRRARDGVYKAYIGGSGAVFGDPQISYNELRRDGTVDALITNIEDLARSPHGGFYFAARTNQSGFVIYFTDSAGRIEHIAGDGRPYRSEEGASYTEGEYEVVPDGTNIRNSSLPAAQMIYDDNRRMIQLGVGADGCVYAAFNMGTIYRIDAEGVIQLFADLRGLEDFDAARGKDNGVQSMFVLENGGAVVMGKNAIVVLDSNGGILHMIDLIKALSEIPILRGDQTRLLSVTPNRQGVMIGCSRSTSYTMAYLPFEGKPTIIAETPIGDFRRNSQLLGAYDAKRDIFYTVLSHGGTCEGDAYLWRVTGIGKTRLTSIDDWFLH